MPMRKEHITRRSFIATSACAIIAVIPRRVRTARWTGRQFHNQPVESHEHQFLVDLWSAVKSETAGDLDITVYPQNNNIPGSDPAALEMLRNGELEFFTL